MLVSCLYCGGMHPRGVICKLKPSRSGRKEDNYISRFRRTMPWRRKRIEIRKRDLELCQYCKKMGYYQFRQLQVHHIESIAEKWHKRLENDNLITLCTKCHSYADLGKISKRELLEIVEKNKIGR